MNSIKYEIEYIEIVIDKLRDLVIQLFQASNKLDCDKARLEFEQTPFMIEVHKMLLAYDSDELGLIMDKIDEIKDSLITALEQIRLNEGIIC